MCLSEKDTPLSSFFDYINPVFGFKAQADFWKGLDTELTRGANKYFMLMDTFS